MDSEKRKVELKQEAEQYRDKILAALVSLGYGVQVPDDTYGSYQIKVGDESVSLHFRASYDTKNYSPSYIPQYAILTYDFRRQHYRQVMWSNKNKKWSDKTAMNHAKGLAKGLDCIAQTQQQDRLVNQARKQSGDKADEVNQRLGLGYWLRAEIANHPNKLKVMVSLGVELPQDKAEKVLRELQEVLKNNGFSL